jgi:hypothetical protein
MSTGTCLWHHHHVIRADWCTRRQTDGVPETDNEKEAGKRTLMDKMRGYRVGPASLGSTLRHGIFLERASSSFGEDQAHDMLPGPFAPERARIEAVSRKLGVADDEELKPNVLRGLAQRLGLDSAPEPEVPSEDGTSASGELSQSARADGANVARGRTLLDRARYRMVRRLLVSRFFYGPNRCPSTMC